MKHFNPRPAGAPSLAALALLVALSHARTAPAQSQSFDQLLRAASAPYWQQQVDYRLQVQLDDQRHELRATEEITYLNRSPDPLDFIWFHLYPNAYRDTHTAFARQRIQSGSREFQFAPDSSRGFIDELAFTVDGAPARLEYSKRSPDVAKLVLPKPLAPGGQVVIRTPFHVKLPKTWSRGGHEGQSYQVTQWFPKPAVYDRAGWHPMPYLDQGEFYADFGSYDVSITLPANYVVGATGELQNPEERAFMDSLAAEGARKAAQGPDGFGPKPRRTRTGYAEATPRSSPRLKTLHYQQANVVDFAWFADKRYQALKSQVTLPRSGRQVTTWLLFSPGVAKGWVAHRTDIDAAVLGYSRLVGEYPFSAATALAGPLGPGTGGMEYPMVTITEPSAIIHEVGHNWFQGILASNERDYPWLDEGVNSYTENRVKALRDSARAALTSPAATPKASKGGEAARAARAAAYEANEATLGLGPKTLKLLGADGLPAYAVSDVVWQIGLSRSLNQPIGSRSEAFTPINYGADVYARTPAELRYLAAYLGQARFDSCMHHYYRQWSFKHPQPADMLGAFSTASGQNLTWFFRDRLTTLGQADAGLGRMRVEDSIRVRVFNQGDSLLTVPVTTLDAQGRVLDQRWTPLFREQGVLSLPLNPAAVRVVVDPRYVVPTIRRADDHKRLHGVLRAWNPVRIRPLLSFDRWDRTTLTVAPLVGANTSDKFMAGLYLSNSSLVQRRVRFQVAPMYSFARNEVNGYGEAAYTVLGGGRLAETTTAVRVARFERYLKLEPSLTLRFRPGSPRGARQLAQLGVTLIKRDGATLFGGGGDDGTGGAGAARWGRYEVRLGNALRQLTATARFENFYAAALTDRLGPTVRFDGANVLKVSARYEQFYSRRKSVVLRGFAGAIVNKRKQDYIFLGLSGSPDYLRETVFLDRAQVSRALRAGPRQTDDRDGGFHAWVPVLSNRWVATAGLEAQVPLVPLTLFGDVGATPGVRATGAAQTYYGTGLIVPLLNNVLRFYLPLAGSSYAHDTPASWADLSSNIRFSLHLESLLPEHQIRQALGQ